MTLGNRSRYAVYGAMGTIFGLATNYKIPILAYMATKFYNDEPTAMINGAIAQTALCTVTGLLLAYAKNRKEAKK